jgi:ubiquitin-conjugating enzyme E2 J1
VNDDIFLWHFTIRGPRETPFEGGVYHGLIHFPPRFPLQPPDIFFSTPNGRFAVDTAICLNVTSYHPEEWNPVWSVRAFLSSIIAFLPTDPEGALGAVQCDAATRRELAIQSREWRCPECDLVLEPDPIPQPALPDPPAAVQEGPAERPPDEEGSPTMTFVWHDLMAGAAQTHGWSLPYFDIPILILLLILVATVLLDDGAEARARP